MLMFRTRHSLDRILRGKGKLTLGADAAMSNRRQRVTLWCRCRT
jgi:hypothetical protein